MLGYEKDLDAVLWGLKAIGAPEDPRKALQRNFTTLILPILWIGTRDWTCFGLNPAQDFMWLVVLIYHTRGLFNLDQECLSKKKYQRVFLVVSFLQKMIAPQPEDFTFLEFYAGNSALTRCARRKGKVSARFDIKYHTGSGKAGRKKRTNFMDLLTPSGFLFLVFVNFVSDYGACKNQPPIISAWLHIRLAIVFILKGKPGFLAWFAIKCSSFVAVNAGTSGRTACSPVGFLEHVSVRIANTLLERTAFYSGICFLWCFLWALVLPGVSM